MVATDHDDGVTAIALAIRARAQAPPHVRRIDHDDHLTVREHLLGGDLAKMALAHTFARKTSRR
jgi:hypothetical protein